MKKLVIVILSAVLAACLVQSHYNARCYVYGFDDAAITVNGIYCHTHRPNLVKTYMRLKDLDERAKKPVIDPRMHMKFNIKRG